VIDSDGTVNLTGCVLSTIWLGLAIHNRAKGKMVSKALSDNDNQKTSTFDYMHKALSVATLHMREPVHVACVDSHTYGIHCSTALRGPPSINYF
jgi:hypothetical protein